MPASSAKVPQREPVQYLETSPELSLLVSTLESLYPYHWTVSNMGHEIEYDFLIFNFFHSALSHVSTPDPGTRSSLSCAFTWRCEDPSPRRKHNINVKERNHRAQTPPVESDKTIMYHVRRRRTFTRTRPEHSSNRCPPSRSLSGFQGPSRIHYLLDHRYLSRNGSRDRIRK